MALGADCRGKISRLELSVYRSAKTARQLVILCQLGELVISHFLGTLAFPACSCQIHQIAQGTRQIR
ncbi:hypothetical protein RSP795_08210 [Ralstonia solanacearum]|nr:hypothetical protein RSP795_08210 [Ralstonia solanacearum]